MDKNTKTAIILIALSPFIAIVYYQLLTIFIAEAIPNIGEKVVKDTALAFTAFTGISLFLYAAIKSI